MFSNKYMFHFLLSIISLQSVDSFNMAFSRRTFISNCMLMQGNNIIRNRSIMNNAPSDYENQDSFMPMNHKLAKRSIYFNGELNDDSCFQIYQALINNRNTILSDEKSESHIDLYIQSPGGALLPSLALSDEIRMLDVPVYTYVRGFTASAATLLSVVGAKRYMYNNSVYMIHGLKFGESANIQTLPQARDLESNIDTFLKIIKNIYMTNSNLNEEQLEYMFMRDIWMNAQQALNYGLIDEIL